uniref:PCF11 cleavage and polyadenylation factor subunit n=1 Tax=Rousettus aegyptiacus TaxID=9407 RepID=A0A7J8H4B5_ROUAE|nr:PCF11 cleavage and polyadenylation factor subunit [Rousettus aegyptiacus]
MSSLLLCIKFDSYFSIKKVYEKSRDHHSMIVFHLSDLDMKIQINHL